MPADPIVLRRFHVPLRLRPGDVALYSLLQEPDGRTWLRWDGVRRSTRIPPEYAQPASPATGELTMDSQTPGLEEPDLPPPRPPEFGLAFLDNSVLRGLRTPADRQRLWEKLDHLGLTLLLTELNVLQAMAAGPGLGRELLTILTEVARSPWVLPTPDVLLRDAIAQVTGPHERLSAELFALHHPDAIEDFEAECARARAWTANADAAYRDYLNQHRAQIRPKLRAAYIRPTLEHLPAFIANWPAMSEYAEYRQHLWGRLGFEGAAPEDIERRLPVLRLEMAAQGVGLFEHTLAYDGGRPTERTDLLQLCYLGMAEHSLLISNDIGQRRAASIVLPLSGLQGFAISLDDLLK